MKTCLKENFSQAILSWMRSEKTRFEKRKADWLAKIARCDTDAPAATSVMVSTIRSPQLSGLSSTSCSSSLLAKTAANQRSRAYLFATYMKNVICRKKN